MIKKLLLGIWKEFYNEFSDAWNGLSLVDFYGLRYWHLKKNHPILAKLLCMITAISYIFYWLGFGLVFFGAAFAPLVLFFYYRQNINYWYVYEFIYIVLALIFLRIEIYPWFKKKLNKGD